MQVKNLPWYLNQDIIMFFIIFFSFFVNQLTRKNNNNYILALQKFILGKKLPNIDVLTSEETKNDFSNSQTLMSIYKIKDKCTLPGGLPGDSVCLIWTWVVPSCHTPVQTSLSIANTMFEVLQALTRSAVVKRAESEGETLCLFLNSNSQLWSWALSKDCKYKPLKLGCEALGGW